MIAEANQSHEYFVLVSNKEKDPFKALAIYRRHEIIVSFFEAQKQHADGTRIRVWNINILRAPSVCTVCIAILLEYLSEQIHQFKKTLAVETDNPAHDTKQVMNAD